MCVLQAEQQGEAGDVLVPLRSEQLHVDVLDGRRVVSQVHLLRHAVLPHLTESVCTHTQKTSPLTHTNLWVLAMTDIMSYNLYLTI